MLDNNEKQEVFNWDVQVKEIAEQLGYRCGPTVDVPLPTSESIGTIMNYFIVTTQDSGLPSNTGNSTSNTENVVSHSFVDKPGAHSQRETSNEETLPLSELFVNLAVETYNHTPKQKENKMFNDVDNPHVDNTDHASFVIDNMSDIWQKHVQATLSEPLFECRLGWAYDPTRVNSKRTGLPLLKKPSYRYAKTPDFVLGRKHEDLGGMLDLWLNSASLRTCVVFIPHELWSRYPDSQSYTKPHGPTLFDNFPVSKHETEGTDWNAVLPQFETQEKEKTQKLANVVDDSFVDNSFVDNTGKKSLWKRFRNWINL